MAKRQEIRQGAAGYIVTEVVVHCSATGASWYAGRKSSEKVAEIRRWHVQDRKWRDIGYHFVIDRDGTMLPGRRETEIGAGVEGHNRGVLHICLIGGGGSAATDPFERNFTAAQGAALRKVLASIRLRTPVKRISGHNEHAAKACPGFSVPKWLEA